MNLPEPLFLAAIAIRSAIVLIALVLGIRIFGNRDVGGMNLIDVVMVLLLGNAVQNALTASSGQLWVGIVSAGVLLVIDRAMGILFVASPWLERKLSGEPVVLVAHGRLLLRNMRRAEIYEDELMAAVRDQGLPDLSRVRLAVLEDNGSISIVPEEGDD